MVIPMPVPHPALPLPPSLVFQLNPAKTKREERREEGARVPTKGDKWASIGKRSGGCSHFWGFLAVGKEGGMFCIDPLPR